MKVDFLRDPAAAEEVAQDVFLELHKRLGTLTSPEHVTFWLRKVTSHRCIDYARRRRWAQVSLDEVPEMRGDTATADPLLARSLGRLVASLPETARMVVRAVVEEIIKKMRTSLEQAMARGGGLLGNRALPVEVRVRPLYNPALETPLFIVPGIIGVLLSNMLIIITAIAVVRERETGTLEQLIVTPLTRSEIMLGKIIPYIMVGFVQVALVIGIGIGLFGVPLLGSLSLLALLSTLFITTNLSIGYTFSTVAQNQLQAMQMSIMYFLPNILLSGFMFPFRGMPEWAQWLGTLLPLTHFLHLVRGIMLKGTPLLELWPQIWPLFAFMLAVIAIGVRFYKRTLD